MGRTALSKGAATWFETTGVALTSGVGGGGSQLNAFDSALRDGGIADYNLIKVSSIVPPDVPVVRISDSAQPISGEGLMVPTIYAELSTAVEGTELAVAVGVGIALEPEHAAGIVFVASCEGSRVAAESSVRAMVDEGMEAKGIVEHEVAVASAHTVVERGWTSVVAAAVFMDTTIEATIGSQTVPR